MSVDEQIAAALASVERCKFLLEQMRAERWIMQWPPGHAERPKEVPEFVRKYERIKAHAVQSGNPVQG